MRKEKLNQTYLYPIFKATEQHLQEETHSDYLTIDSMT